MDDDKEKADNKEPEQTTEEQFGPPPKETRFTPPKESSFTPPVMAHQKHSRKRLWLAVVLLVVITGIGLLAYLWYSEKDRADQLDKQVNSLIEQKQAASNDNSGNDTAVITNAQYKAEVGKFTLTLADKYYIIVEHDGGFEGGPITQLRVASKGDKGTQTVTAPTHQSVVISAVPLGDTTFEDRVEGSLSEYEESERSQLSAVKVDGTNAQVWRLSGLFNDKRLFVSKNGIFYTITAGDAGNNEGHGQTVLDDVLKGFKFNS